MKVEMRTIFKEWILPLFISLAIVLVVKNFLYDPCRVRGLSMYPTLEGTEFIIVNKWKYWIDKPKQGDIIVFHTAEKRDFIKRVIGVPGDRIAIHDGKVYRNGHVLIENYIEHPTFGGRGKEVLVANDELYVLGDNRPNSKDSRMIGPVKTKEVVGRADYVVYPFNEMRTFTG